MKNFIISLLIFTICAFLGMWWFYTCEICQTNYQEKKQKIEEIIREKILKHYKKEVPYSVEIEVEEFFEEEEIIRIRAIIYVLRESQKGILIGHKGLGLKRIGTEARKDIEKMLEKKVFLATPIKVKKDWRNDNNQLKKFGYGS